MHVNPIIVPEVKIEESAAIDHLRSIVGLRISHAWRGYGSTIFLELGDLTAAKGVGKRSKPHGECTVMIQWSWRFEEGNRISVGSWSEDEEIDNLPQKLSGLRVLEAAFFSRLKELELKLSRECWLLSFSTADGDPEWSVRSRDGGWLSFSDGAYTVESTRERQ